MRHRAPFHREFFSESGACLRVVCCRVRCVDDPFLSADAFGLPAIVGDGFCFESEKPKLVGPFLDERRGLFRELELVAVVCGEDVRWLGALHLAVGQYHDMLTGIYESIQGGQEPAHFLRCHHPSFAEPEILYRGFLVGGE